MAAVDQEDSPCLVVVGVFEGRNFPRRPQHRLVVEAQFHGERLSSEGVWHEPKPQFYTELAWEMTRRSLHQHKLKRTPVKLACFAVDTLSNRREAIGYFMLDLRTVQTSVSTEARWHTLQSCKYAQSKAQLRVVMDLEVDGQRAHHATVHEHAAAAHNRPGAAGAGKKTRGSGQQRSATAAGVAGKKTNRRLLGGETSTAAGHSRHAADGATTAAFDPSAGLPLARSPATLTSVLDEEEGCFVIPPLFEHENVELFLLSLTITSGSNLAQLVPHAQSGVPSYHFYFSLLGNDITMETFSSLVRFDFKAEKATVRLKSSFETLAVYLSAQKPVMIHLCCGKQSLGCAVIELAPLLNYDSAALNARGMALSQSCILHSLDQTVTSLTDEEKPAIDVTLSLSPENDPLPSTQQAISRPRLSSDSYTPGSTASLIASAPASSSAAGAAVASQPREQEQAEQQQQWQRQLSEHGGGDNEATLPPPAASDGMAQLARSPPRSAAGTLTAEEAAPVAISSGGGGAAVATTTSIPNPASGGDDGHDSTMMSGRSDLSSVSQSSFSSQTSSQPDVNGPAPAAAAAATSGAAMSHTVQSTSARTTGAIHSQPAAHHSGVLSPSQQAAHDAVSDTLHPVAARSTSPTSPPPAPVRAAAFSSSVAPTTSPLSAFRVQPTTQGTASSAAGTTAQPAAQQPVAVATHRAGHTAAVAQASAQSHLSASEQCRHPQHPQQHRPYQQQQHTHDHHHLSYQHSSAGIPAPTAALGTVHSTMTSASDGDDIMQWLADQRPHHFTVAIDLRSVKDVSLPHITSPALQLRYCNPFFSSTSPITTDPPLVIASSPAGVPSGSEYFPRKSFCTFDFAALPSQFNTQCSSSPILVEAWHCVDAVATKLLGTTRLHVRNVLQQPQQPVQSGGRVGGWRRAYTSDYDVLSLDSPAVRVFSLCASVSVEDHGPVHLETSSRSPVTAATLGGHVTPATGRVSPTPSTATVVLSRENAAPGAGATHHATSLEAAEEEQSQNQPYHQPLSHLSTSIAPDQVADRDSAAYQAALQLELWKAAEEERFRETLEARKKQQLQLLAEEWKRRDLEREMSVTKKIEEYEKLEQQLRTALVDVEQKEKQLRDAQQETTLLRSSLETQKERLAAELRDTTERLQETFRHQLDIERSRNQESESQRQQMQQQLSDLQRAVRQREEELLTCRADRNTQPEVKLQAEMSIVQMEKAELARKLDTCQRSKAHYKEQWAKALRELARYRQQQQKSEKERLKEQQRELDHMRLRYLAHEEKAVLKDGSVSEVERLKSELEQLRTTALQSGSMSDSALARKSSGAPATASPFSPKKPHTDAAGSQLPVSPGKTSHSASSERSPHRQKQQHQHQHNLPAHHQPTPVIQTTYMDDAVSVSSSVASRDEHMARLIGERDTLLRTGVYSHNDHVIKELDRQIRQIMAKT